MEILILYFSLSLLLNLYPQILFKKKQTPLIEKLLKKTHHHKLIAHRCALDEAPENSITGVHHCHNLNIFGVELDIRKTKDNKYIIAHDASLKFLTGQDIKVGDIDYHDIKPIVDNKYVPYKTYLIDVKNHKKEKPPLIDDFFKAVRNTDLMVNIDIKSGKKEELYYVLEKCKEYKITDRIIIGSFQKLDYEKTRKDFDFNIHFFMCVSEYFKIYFYFLIGILPFMSINVEVMESPHFFEGCFEPFFLYLKKKKIYRLFRIIFWLLKYISKYLKRYLNRRGIPVIYFVANTKKDMDLCNFLEADAIICDNPKELTKAFKRNYKK